MLNEAGGLFYRDLFSSICFPCIFRLDAKNCKRINIGGCQAAVYLQRLLQLKYPGHFAAITLSRMEEILHEHSYIAEDYIEGKNTLLITKYPSRNLRSENSLFSNWLGFRLKHSASILLSLWGSFF